MHSVCGNHKHNSFAEPLDSRVHFNSIRSNSKALCVNTLT